MDFISIPQRPFGKDQKARTDEENDVFNKALQVMTYVYLYADVIIHIDYEPDVGAYEDDIYLIDGVELMPTTLAQVGPVIQVVAIQESTQSQELYDESTMDAGGDDDLSSPCPDGDE